MKKPVTAINCILKPGRSYPFIMFTRGLGDAKCYQPSEASMKRVSALLARAIYKDTCLVLPQHNGWSAYPKEGQL